MKEEHANKFASKNANSVLNNEASLIDKNSAKKLFPILSEYSFFDLCRAVFCINSWRYNRPNLSFYLALNYVLSKIDRTGTRPIQTYKQFMSFYDSIMEYNNSTLNDPIIPDFGEIKVVFNGTFYPILIGNGYNHAYPLMKCLDANISAINKEKEMEDVLSYVLEMVDALQNIEPFDSNKYQYNELSCPSENYFCACLEYYQRLSPPDDCFIRKLSFEEQKDITTSHFLIEQGKVLVPLFNPSIIVDAYNTIMLNLPQLKMRRNQIADRAVYSRLCSNFDIMKRYILSNKDSLSEEAKERTIINTINLREEEKNQIRDLCYLIDTNLSLERTVSKLPNNNDVEYLLAFSHWLMLLQDCADQAHYKLFDAQIEIEDDYRVSTKYPNDGSDYANVQNRRIYSSKDYVPQIADDEVWLNKALSAFYKDTSVSLVDIISLCYNYLSFEFYNTFTHEAEPDVFEINREELIADLESALTDKNQIDDYVKAIDYLTIDTSKIKNIGDEKNSFVPVWEREKRDQRFDVRPIVKSGNMLIFSPVVMYELATMWEVGLQEFYPPYEINLNNFTIVLRQWKKKCETQMETDINELCKNAGYITFKNLKLSKINKRYPSDLGDYDVLAIDTDKKIIWNLESKFLIKVGSIKEYANHQNTFFVNDKKDEKFAKRIEYLSTHLKDIFESLGIDDASKYTIKNLMITNKVFTSSYKKVGFDIITFFELKVLLSQQ